jgi:hypothetical protein
MLQEIPPGEQLMGLSVEPSVPENLQFVFEGLIWPDDGALASKSVHADLDLREDTLEWIGKVLKPEWAAPDLRNRLRAASAIVSRRDAFVARYALDENKIQIVVTSSSMHFVISPAGGSLFMDAPAVMRHFLRVDPPDDQSPWRDEPWSIIAVDGFTFGYHPRSSLAGWRDSLNYLTNRRTVKFSIKKVATYPPGFRNAPKTSFAPTEESERHWFAQALEPPVE